MPSPRHALLALALLTPVLTAAPADAVEETGLPRTNPTMSVEISYRSGYHYVCARGKLNGQDQPSDPTWTVIISGTRSNGTLISLQDSEVSSIGDLCLAVLKERATEGAYSVTFTYHGFGNDLPSGVGAAGLWAPGRDHHVTYGQGT